MSISRREALLGATAAVAVAGLPAVTNAAAPDAMLFALIDELERVERKRIEIRTAEAMERRATQSRLPMPPASIRLSEERSIMGRDGVARWQTLSPTLIESTRAARMRDHPERFEQIIAHSDRLLAELNAYEAEVERLRNSTKVRALRAHREKIIERSNELVLEISTTPTDTVSGVLRKLEAADLFGRFGNSTAIFVSAATAPMIASAMRDLERLAGEARS